MNTSGYFAEAFGPEPGRPEVINYSYLRAKGRDWCKVLNRGDKPSDRSWWECQRAVNHAGHHMSISADGTLLSEWVDDGIDSLTDDVDTDDMTDTKYTPEADHKLRPTVDEMIKAVGPRKAFQWLHELTTPEFAKAALLDWLNAQPAEPTNPFNPSAMPHYPGAH